MQPEAIQMNSAPRTAVDEEPQLVDQAREGSLEAFEHLYRKYSGRIHGLCLRMTGNTHAAEDCAQDAFVKAWQKLNGFRGKSGFGTWLYRIAVNEVLSRIRKEGRRTTHLRAVAEAATDAGPGLRERHDEGIDIDRAVKSLPEGARHVFVLHSVYGFSHEETAQMLGVAIGTSKAQLHRARHLLCDVLDR